MTPPAIPPQPQVTRLPIRGVAAAVLLIGLAAGYFFLFTATSADDLPLHEVARGDFVITLVESGEVQAARSEKIVTPEVHGRLQITYLWPEGGYVDVGDIVVEYDKTEAASRLLWTAGELEQARSNYVRSKAEIEQKLTDLEIAIEQSKASLKLARINLDRAKLRSKIELEEAKIRLEQAERGLVEAKENMRAERIATEVDLRSQEVDISRKEGRHERNLRSYRRHTVYATQPGLVVYEKIRKSGQLRKVRVGDDLWDGVNIISLPELKLFQVILQVGEMDIKRLAVEQPATVRLDAYPEMLFNGRVSTILPMANPSLNAPNVQVFEVVVDIEEESSLLRPGMSALAEIIVEAIQDTIHVPREAVFHAADRLAVVYRLEGSSFAETEVRVGMQNAVSVMIDSGLAAGDKIALVAPN